MAFWQCKSNPELLESVVLSRLVSQVVAMVRRDAKHHLQRLLRPENWFSLVACYTRFNNLTCEFALWPTAASATRSCAAISPIDGGRRPNKAASCAKRQTTAQPQTPRRLFFQKCSKHRGNIGHRRGCITLCICIRIHNRNCVRSLVFSSLIGCHLQPCLRPHPTDNTQHTHQTHHRPDTSPISQLGLLQFFQDRSSNSPTSSWTRRSVPVVASPREGWG